jgi:uncharacterized membrane protein
LVAVSAASLATFAIYRLKKIWQLVMFSTVIIICGLLAVGTRYGFGVLKDGEAASIDGYSYLRTADPAKLAVINWANHNIKGQPIVVQAPGDSYSTNSWFSSYTGLPSPMGWTEHEWTWRYSANEWSIITARTAIITNLYDADSPAYLKQQASLLKADYILLGPDELSVYEVHRNVFNNAFGQPLYNNASYAIYKVD